MKYRVTWSGFAIYFDKPIVISFSTLPILALSKLVPNFCVRHV